MHKKPHAQKAKDKISKSKKGKLRNPLANKISLDSFIVIGYQKK